MTIYGDEILVGDSVVYEVNENGHRIGAWHVVILAKYPDGSVDWAWKMTPTIMAKERDERFNHSRRFIIDRPAPVVNEFGPVSP